MQCVNLETSLSNASPPVSRNLETTYLFYQYLAPTRRCPPKISTISSYTPPPNGWENQAYLKGWDFDMKNYKDTSNRFERMEAAEKIYKGTVTTSKNPIRADVNRASYGRKLNRG